MAIKILEIQQNSEEWLIAREGKVTGSIADNLLSHGLDHALRQNYNRFNGNYFTRRGHILEEEAIEVYEAIHGVTVSRPGMVINDKYPNAACSPDGLEGEFLIEVKCFALKKHTRIFTEKDVRAEMKIMSQLQFNMMITELKKAKLVMYNPDCDNPKDCYREIIVKANATIQRHLAFQLKEIDT